jgi:hypothetical protein
MNPRREASTDSSKEKNFFHYYMAERVAERCRSCESLRPQNHKIPLGKVRNRSKVKLSIDRRIDK